MKKIEDMSKQEMIDTYELMRSIINNGGELTDEQWELGMKLHDVLKEAKQ